MKKGVLTFLFLLTAFLNFSISITFCQEIIEVKFPSIFNANAGQTIKIPIQIKNIGLNKVDVFLNVFPPYYEGITAYFDRNELSILQNSEETVNLIVSIPFERMDKIVTYQIFLNYNGVQKVYKLYLNVIGIKGEINVESFWINKYNFNPNETLEVFVTYKNTKDISTSIKVKVEILKENEILETYEKFLNILARTQINFSYSYNFSYFHEPGKYYFNIYSFDDKEVLISKLTFEVVLNEIEDVEKDVKAESKHLVYKVSVRLKNKGNIIQKITLEEEFPLILKPFVIFEGFRPEMIGNRVVWNITLKPLEEVVISYSIIYWIPFIIVLVILLSVTLLIIFFIFVPKAIKKYEKIEDIYKVRIILKNNTNKKMRNIEIRDFVPLLFSITNFETLKPQIVKTRDGYNLIWKVRDLKPKEEIIISYHIKPLVEIIGEIKLPKPQVKYVLR